MTDKPPLRECAAEAMREHSETIKEALLDNPDRLSAAMLNSTVPEWSSYLSLDDSMADLCATIYRAHRVIECLTRGDSMEQIMGTIDITHWRAFVRSADTIKANLDVILDEEVAEHLG
jgi:hypothetical protein